MTSYKFDSNERNPSAPAHVAPPSKPAELLLLIDVSKTYHRAFADWAESEGIHIVTCDRSAISACSSDTILCVYESQSRSDLLNAVRKLASELQAIPLVVLAPKFSIDDAARIIAGGVLDVIRIPAAPDEVLARAATRVKRVADRQINLDLIGRSPVMQRFRRELFAAAPLDSIVLFTGETGTGKGLAAHILHHYSKRRHFPFLHADCSGLVESLIESELFGHERGAFTGAVAPRTGRFEAAGRGTLFLDEIGELSVGLQAKLLRALQDRVFERVGSNRPRELFARIVAATNRDLTEDIGSGRFRKDLYYRLNVIRIEMPPLRDRIEDIPDLVQTLMPQIAARTGIAAPVVPTGFHRFLADYSWPGNVRELINVLERIAVYSHAGLLKIWSPQELGIGLACRPKSSTAARREPHWRNRGEEQRILAAQLEASGGNVSLAARNLGIARSTLRYRIKIHNLSPPSQTD